MTYAWQRSSYVRYRKRPPSNCRAARWAWDHFAQNGAIKTLWLGEGYWMVERLEGFSGERYDEIDATVARAYTAKDSKWDVS